MTKLSGSVARSIDRRKEDRRGPSACVCGTDCGWMEVRSFLAQERRRCACACDAELQNGEWRATEKGERERERETQWGATLAIQLKEREREARRQPAKRGGPITDEASFGEEDLRKSDPEN